MRRFFTFLIILLLFTAPTWAQSLKPGKVIEYQLPTEDCQKGQFYLGRFVVGEYEISGNVAGIHANNRGWKIMIGRQWGVNSPIQFKSLFNNVGGSFVYQTTDNAYFDLWWDPKFNSGGQSWTPYVKVEYQVGNCIYNQKEPARDNIKVLSSAENITTPVINQTQANTNNYFAGNIYMKEATSGSSKLYFRGQANDIATIFSEQYGESAGTKLVFEVADDTNEYFQFRHRYWNEGKITNLMDIKLTQTVIHKPLGVGAPPTSGKMLTVNGAILAKEVEVSTEAAYWPDYVFEEEYPLRKLSDVESFIKINKHLPDMPSAEEVEKDGVKLAEMNKLLLQKIEELTLYTIELEKKDKEKAQKVETLEKRLAKIEALLSEKK